MMDEVVYGASLGGQVVVLIYTHSQNSEINKERDVPFGMSILYRMGPKRITSFLLDLEGFLFVRFYEFSPKFRKFQLSTESYPIETADSLFDQFEKDFNSSPTLRSLDTDFRLSGSFIPKTFSNLPEDPHPSELNKFSANRDKLSYSEKLNQQASHRNDPIEIILKTLHGWEEIIAANIGLRLSIEKEELDAAKKKLSCKKKTVIKVFPEYENLEKKVVVAYEEIDKLERELANPSQWSKAEIEAKRRKLKGRQCFILSQKQALEKEIDRTVSKCFEEKNKNMICIESLYSEINF